VLPTRTDQIQGALLRLQFQQGNRQASSTGNPYQPFSVASLDFFFSVSEKREYTENTFLFRRPAVLNVTRRTGFVYIIWS
jgi:hypothetical protein